MTEQRETLSALMDGEASEIEVHRLLRQIGENESLKETWLSWHQIRSVVQGSVKDQHMPIAQHLELHRNIQQAIAAEETYAMKGTSTPRSIGIRRPLAGLAIAASLVVAVFVGMQVEQQTGNSAAPAVAGNTSPDAGVRTPVAVQTVANRATNTAPAGHVAAADAPLVDAEMDEGLRALDEEGQKRLRAYLHQHDQMARMKSNTSLVTYPSNK